VFDADPQRFGERDRIGDVPAVAVSLAPTNSPSATGVPAQGPQDMRRPQGLIRLVFGAGAEGLRLFGAANVKEVVAFTEPAHLGLNDVQDGADVVPCPLDTEKLVILALGGGLLQVDGRNGIGQ